MKLRDWTKIVDAYLKKSSNNFDKYEDSVLFSDDESVVAEP